MNMQLGDLLLAFSLLSLMQLHGAAALMKESDESLNFLVIGDWGGQPTPPYYTAAEMEVSKAMGDAGNVMDSKFTLALGDNFYDSGVKDVNDPRFKYTFENVFTSSALQTKWYIVCGNHDHYGNCSAEIAYTKMSNRWYFPDYYYSELFDVPGSDKKLAIVFIDTVILAGVTHPKKRHLPPYGPASPADAEQQWDWINSTLSQYSNPAANVGWILVAGHYPVWSVAEHGPTKILVDRLKPLLEQYGVTAYICGHDHNLQHINDTLVQYYVTGAGHEVDDSEKHKSDVPKKSLQFYYGPSSHHEDTKGGFALASVQKDTLTYTFMDYRGRTLYTSINRK